ncbi:MAG TPA: pre-peptidase C-terminal domain-containing protein, partial [Blastocatellia bacterium]|nr:pre-peptidase C-terminal domain-containing protein [Blastocatellia bacterium]
MKYVSNQSTIVKSTLALLLLGIALFAGVFVAGSTSAAMKSTALGSVVAGIFQQPCEGEQEPNETIAQANSIDVPGKRCGTVKVGDATGGSAGVVLEYNAQLKDKVEDLFTFTVTGEAKNVDITLTFNNPAADLDLMLFKDTGAGAKPTPIAVSNGNTTTERLAPIPTLSAGKYYIGVSAFDDSAVTPPVEYTLSTSLNSTPPPPTITRITPEAAAAGSGPLSITVTGSNFFNLDSKVYWNDLPRPTTFISNVELVAFLTPADVATPGQASVKVVNAGPPGQDGIKSNSVPFTITTSDPEVEPNENSTNATLLTAPGKRSGAVAVGDAATTMVQLPGGVTDPVEDVFAVTLLQNSRLDLSLSGANGQANLALYLFKEKQGTTELENLGNSRQGGAFQRLITPTLLTPGRYLVGVSAVGGASSYILEAKVPGNRLMQILPGSAAPNSSVTLPVVFYAEGNENSLNFSLKFDPSLLGNPQIVLGGDAASGAININNSELAMGRIGARLSLPQGQRFSAGAREVAKVTFAIKPNLGAGTTKVEFGDDPVVRGMVDAGGTAVIGDYAFGSVMITPGLEGDVAPRSSGNGSITIADWVQVGRFVSGVDTPADGSEFQRVDCAPKSTLGDGKLTIADWVLAGLYASGGEAALQAGGPSGPVAGVAAFEKEVLTEGFAQAEQQQQQSRAIRVVPATFNRGAENTVSIELNSQGNENAFGFSVNFDTTQLSFVRATLGANAQGAALNVNNAQIAQGRVGIGIALSSGQTLVTGARQIVNLVFNVPASSSVNSTTISFGDQPIAREVVDATANVLTTNYTAGVITLDPQINQTPSLTSVNPNSVLAGGGNFQITLNGNNFINGATVRVTVDGVTSERLTEFVSLTQLRATLLAQDISETGTISVKVQNPPPNGGMSNSLNINIVNPAPTITTVSPNTASQGGQAFTLTVNGTNFVPGARVQWNGNNRITTFISSTQLTAQIPATDIASGGTFTIRVVNPDPGGGNSNTVNFTVAVPAGIPRITSISPTAILGGSGAFTLTVNGTNFTQNSVVRFNGNALTTTYVSNTRLTAEVPADSIATPGTASITVFTPPPGGGASNAALLTINTPPNPVPAITAINPAMVNSGGGDFTLTVTGTGFVQASVVRINGLSRQTTFVSATELRATIQAGDIVNGGTANITVFNPAPEGGTSNPVPLTIKFAPPVISLLSPSSAVAGGIAFQLTVTGSNFAPGSVVRWNGTDRPTTVDSVTQLTARIPASDIADVGTATITVFSPSPGGGLSNAVSFAINQASRPVPRISSITPTSVLAGSGNITLTVSGTNFVTDSVVRWNGQPRTTLFVNSTQLQAQIPAADLATAGTATVTVFTPPAGGGESNSATFTIEAPPNPKPQVNTISPTSVGAGTGAFTLTVNGTGFIAASVVQFNGANRPTTFVSATQLTAQIAAEDIPAAGTAAIRVVSPAPGGGASNEVTLTIVNAVPQITSLSPSVASEGGPGFTLTVNGTGFVVGSQIAVNGATRITSFVSNTQLKAEITASEIANAGSLSIQVISPGPGGGASNTVSLPIRSRNPLPRLTGISPETVPAGGPGFTLVVTGTNFVNGSVVRVNNVDRPTDFVSETTLAVQISAADVAAGGTLTINVFSPLPGGGMSNPLTLTINNPVPRITSISPDAAAAGNAEFMLVVNGVNFVPSSVVRFNGASVQTTFVTSSQLTAQIPAGLIASGGLLPVVVFNPPPVGGTSNSVNFSVTNPAPAITNINPTQVTAGGGAFSLTVNGSGFVPGSIVRVNSADRTTTFVNANQLTAQITGADIANGGALSITVFNAAPGGGTSNALMLAVTNPAPELTQLVPSSIAVGSKAFTLTLNGNGFVPSSVVQWNGSPRPTTFISNTQLTIPVSESEISSVGTVTVTVVNPAPGGGTSSPRVLLIVTTVNPAPTLLSLSPNSAVAGSAAFTLTVNGENFVPNVVVNWNGSPRPTTFVSTIELKVQITAADVATQGTAAVTAINPAPGGGTSNALNFAITPPNPVPVLNTLVPSVVGVGSPAFTLTLNGSNFVPGSVVQINGSPRTTAFFSATRLFAQITAADVANVGSATITVVNPAPGGGTSNPQTLNISVQMELALDGALLAFGTLSSRRQLANGTVQEKRHFTAEILLTYLRESLPNTL